jgi:hypothetical protein
MTVEHGVDNGLRRLLRVKKRTRAHDAFEAF